MFGVLYSGYLALRGKSKHHVSGRCVKSKRDNTDSYSSSTYMQYRFSCLLPYSSTIFADWCKGEVVSSNPGTQSICREHAYLLVPEIIAPLPHTTFQLPPTVHVGQWAVRFAGNVMCGGGVIIFRHQDMHARDLCVSSQGSSPKLASCAAIFSSTYCLQSVWHSLTLLFIIVFESAERLFSSSFQVFSFPPL